VTGTHPRAFVLDGSESRTEVPLTDAVGLANGGVVVQIEHALDHLGFLAQFEELYLNGIAQVAPPEAVEHLRSQGLQRMHDVLTPEQIADLLPVLDRQAKPLAIPVASGIVALGSQRSQGARSYFICSRTWVRAQVPYRLVADDAAIRSLGHLSGHLVPTSAHRDVDLTHPRGTLSLWAAVVPIGLDNTIELFDVQRSPADSSTEHPDARTVRPVLGPGDVVLFDADRLHASVPNTTDDTRVSIGTRVVFGRTLHYGPGTHWRPFYDARLLGTPLEPLATLQSRCTLAALRRWQWQRAWRRQQARARQDSHTELVT